MMTLYIQDTSLPTLRFGMLGNIIIVEPNAYIAFAGKRVVEQTLFLRTVYLLKPYGTSWLSNSTLLLI